MMITLIRLILLTRTISTGIMRKIEEHNKNREEYKVSELVETGGQRLKAPSATPLECPSVCLPKKFEFFKE